MKKKHSALKDLLFVSISSTVVVIAWIVFNLYHTWVTTTITPEMQITITAIVPDFDTPTIQKLRSRKQVTPITTLSGRAIAEPSVEPTPPAAVPTIDPRDTVSLGSPTPTTSVPVADTTPVTPVPTSAGAAQSNPPAVNIPAILNGE